MRAGFRIFSLGSLIALGLGCAGGSVRVAYPQPKNPEMLRWTRALGNLYIIIDPHSLEGAGGIFARELGKVLEKKGAHVLAYRVVKRAGETDPFASRLMPAGILTVDLESMTTEITGEEKKWRFGSRLDLRIRLAGYPGGEALGDLRRTVGFRDSTIGTAKEKPDVNKWTRKKEKDILRAAAREIAALFVRIRVVRRKRTLHTDKEDPLSTAARKAAAGGQWERASQLWAERLESGKGSWRETMNLAVAAEVRREFSEAVRLYEKARDSCGGEAECAKIDWATLFGDLTAGLKAVGRRSQKAVAWFETPTAVLPFTDDTTSVEGPETLRVLFHGALTRGGYNMIDLESVDRTLREHGITQGGHLKGRHKPRYARWLGAGRLFFGDITAFDEIMLGAYGRRHVGGSLRLWELSSGKFIWEGSESALRQSATLKKGEAIARFAGQLLRGLFERIRNKPLGPESALFIRQNAETLPLKL